MASVHCLQTASFNANHGKNTYPLLAIFGDMRSSFHHEWTQMEDFLRRCYDYSDQIVKLKECWGTYEADEVRENLEGLAVQRAQLHLYCADILAQHKSITTKFNESIARLNRLPFHSPAPRKRTLSPSPSKLTRELGRTPVRRTTGELSSEDREFIRSSSQAVYPDGPAAISSISTSLTKAEDSLNTIHSLLGAVRAPRNLGGSVPAVANVEREDLDWAQLRDCILNIIPLLPRVRDALSVEPVLPKYPVGRPSLSPRSSELFEKPLPSRRSTLRRASRRSTQEEAPKIRWRFWCRLRR